MPWIVLDAALGVAGLTVLAVLGARVWSRVRALTREVRTASARLAVATEPTPREQRPPERVRGG